MAKNDTSKTKNTNPVWLRPVDRARLEYLCELETRSMVDQMSVIIAEAFGYRGINPETLDTFEPAQQKYTTQEKPCDG